MKNYSRQSLRQMSLSSAQELAEDIRRFLVENVTLTGGHLASNLGIVEISLALLRAFDPPRDKIIYDTGHQSYVHKLLTGRLKDFPTLRQYGGISGFPKRSESEFDAFGAGHSSTSVSAAVGFAQAARLRYGDKAPYSVAVIGDGAFTGGMVFEALNNIHAKSRLIIILNDNEMSISPSVGALANHLNNIRSGDNYYDVMQKSREMISSIPLVGKPVAKGIVKVKSAVKSMLVTPSNLFEMFGVRYFGPANGNDMKTVENLLKVAKKQDCPCIIHLHTKKGKGYEPAEQNPSGFHSVSAPKKGKASGAQSFSSVFGDKICALAQKESRLVAVTAAMCDGVGLNAFAEKYPDRFFDVGIAEEHALTSCAAMSAGGLLPVFAVYSTFFQRSYDQLLHDAALQKLKLLLVLDRAGIVGEDGPTHHGLFDVSLTLNIPGMRIYSPAAYSELERAMEDFVEKSDCPTVIRIPRGSQDSLIQSAFPCRDEVEIASASDDPDCVIISYGRICSEALKAAELLKKKNINASVVKINCLKPFDGKALEKIFENISPRLCYFLEEGMKRGGFGEALVCDIATGRINIKAGRLFVRAIEEEFVTHGKLSLLLERYGLSAQRISDEIVGLMS